MVGAGVAGGVTGAGAGVTTGGARLAVKVAVSEAIACEALATEVDRLPMLVIAAWIAAVFPAACAATSAASSA